MGFVHNFIILANCWNNDRMSMLKGSMSYGVHKVTPVHVTMWANSKLCDLAKGKKCQSQNNRSCAQLFTIAKCWNHDRRSMSNGSRSYGAHKISPPPPKCFGRTDAHTDGRSALPSLYRLHRGTTIKIYCVNICDWFDIFTVKFANLIFSQEHKFRINKYLSMRTLFIAMYEIQIGCFHGPKHILFNSKQPKSIIN